MLEKEIEEKLRIGIKEIGGLCLKWVSPGYTYCCPVELSALQS